MSSDMTKQFAVNWNNHMNHIKKAFDNMLSKSELTDVTLYADGRKIGAHKMVLSACSSYFKSLFREFPQEHPVIVLKGVSYPVLIDILKFIYNGEVSVDSEVFDSFLQTAEFLQISGLTDGDKNTNKMEKNDKSNISDNLHINGSQVLENKSPRKDKKRSYMHLEQSTESKRVRETDVTDIKCEPSVLTAIYPEELSDTLQEDSQFPSELMFHGDGHNNYCTEDNITKIEDINSCQASEDQFYNETSSGSVIGVKATKDTFSDNRLKCPICDKEFSHPYSLHHHKPVHLGDTECPICHVVLSRKYNLKMHMKSRHNVT